MPGIFSINSGEITSIIPRAYRLTVFGGDFSTTIGAYGVRGEFAARKPDGDYKACTYIPNPDLQYIAGLDREFGNFSIIFQDLGKYVYNFSTLNKPLIPEETADYKIALWNRMLASQLKKTTHSVSVRPAWTLLHETLSCEILGMYNVTTEELYLKPKLTYDIADDLSLTFGGMLYSGPDETLFGMLDTSMSSIFTEIKISNTAGLLL